MTDNGPYRDEMDAIAVANYVYKHGPEALALLPWRRPSPAPAPARDVQGRYAGAKKRSESLNDKAAFIDKHSYAAFVALRYD